MGRAAAWVLSIWAALRWVSVAMGIGRLRRFGGPARREARRACVTRAASTVFVSVAALYAWAWALRLQPTEPFVGFLAALLVSSAVVGVASAFMQPAQRTPETLDLFRLCPRRPPGGDSRGPGG